MNGKLAFVVDDDAVFTNALTSFLNSKGYNAVGFYNPVEALTASVPLRPDLLLSDFNMGDMDGLTLAARLTERHPNCKVLIITSAAEEDVTHPGFEKFELLHKPVPLAVLLAKVVEQLGPGAGGGVGRTSAPL
jgi:CheY-like chemotaxis protein